VADGAAIAAVAGLAGTGGAYGQGGGDTGQGTGSSSAAPGAADQGAGGSGSSSWFDGLFHGSPFGGIKLGFLAPDTQSMASPYGFFSSIGRLSGSVGRYFDYLGPGVFPMDAPFFGHIEPRVGGWATSQIPGYQGIPANQVPQIEGRQHPFGHHGGPISGPYDALMPWSYGLPAPTDRGAFSPWGWQERRMDFGFVPSGPGRFSAFPPGFLAGNGLVGGAAEGQPLELELPPDEDYTRLTGFIRNIWLLLNSI
jgi:hypothetical protein